MNCQNNRLFTQNWKRDFKQTGKIVFLFVQYLFSKTVNEMLRPSFRIMETYFTIKISLRENMSCLQINILGNIDYFAFTHTVNALFFIPLFLYSFIPEIIITRLNSIFCYSASTSDSQNVY